MSAGLSIRIGVGGAARTRLGELLARVEDLSQFNAAASELMLDQTQTRFREKRDPDGKAWAAHSEATRKRRGPGAPLLEDEGVLRGGIHAAPTAAAAIVETLPLPYAAIQNEGGQAGRNRAVTIPARPYFGFSDKDEAELIELAEVMVWGP